MSRVLTNDLTVLERASLASKHDGTFRPGHGEYAAARRMLKRGYLKYAGVSVMWPYVTFVITDAGLKHLSRENESA